MASTVPPDPRHRLVTVVVVAGGCSPRCRGNVRDARRSVARSGAVPWWSGCRALLRSPTTAPLRPGPVPPPCRSRVGPVRPVPRSWWTGDRSGRGGVPGSRGPRGAVRVSRCAARCPGYAPPRPRRSCVDTGVAHGRRPGDMPRNRSDGEWSHLAGRASRNPGWRTCVSRGCAGPRRPMTAHRCRVPRVPAR